VSADDDPRNEFRAIERLIAVAIGKPGYRGSPITAPPSLLSRIQRLRGRDGSAGRTRYLSEDPLWRTATRVTDLGDAVQRVARGLVEVEG
jgi:hypothetical protein